MIGHALSLKSLAVLCVYTCTVLYIHCDCYAVNSLQPTVCTKTLRHLDYDSENFTLLNEQLFTNFNYTMCAISRDLLLLQRRSILSKCETGLVHRIHELGIQKSARSSRAGCRKTRCIPPVITFQRPEKDLSHNRCINHANLVVVKDFEVHKKFLEDSVTISKNNLHIGFINPRSIRNKTTVVMDEIISKDIDVCCMTETWLTEMDDVKRNDLRYDGYDFRDVCRSGVGGGTGIIFKEIVKCDLVDSGIVQAIEFSEWLLRYSSVEIRILIIYRRPYSSAHPVTTSAFIQQVQDFLSQKVIGKGKLLITGDLNIHLDVLEDRDSIRLTDILSSMDLQQHVRVSTHEHGHTLDVFITRCDGELFMETPQQGLKISDHYLITSRCSVPKPSWETKLVTYRKVNNIDMDIFKDEVSTLCQVLSPCEDLTVLCDGFESGLKKLLDKHAPLREKRMVVRPKLPWFDDNLREMRRKRRRAERVFRRTKSDLHKAAYKCARNQYANQLKASHSSYYYNAIEEASGDQKKLFNLVQSLTNKSKGTPWPEHNNKDTLACDFGVFFNEKVNKLRQSLTSSNVPSATIEGPCDTELSAFRELTSDEVCKLVAASATKQCELDPLPTSLLKLCLDQVLPVLKKIINLSLQNGLFIQSWKEAIVKPLLKKAGMQLELKSYRPVSNLTYISKLVEKAAFEQINVYADTSRLTPSLQSAYRPHHSTETALLKVYSDIIDSMDKGKVVFLVLIDQSAAFDLVDHQMLLRRLNKEYGISGTVLEWCRNYLCNRRQRISIDGHLSEYYELETGVPQGSVGGPCLFTKFAASLIGCIQQWLINTHCYADDSQLYLAFQSGNHTSEHQAKEALEGCINDVRSWMACNRLFMNDSKTEFIVIGTPQQLAKVSTSGIMIGDDFIKSVDSVRNLGAFFDNNLSMKHHINEKCKQAYRQLYRLQNIRNLLNTDATQTLIHAFVTSHLDYSNSLLVDLPKCDIDKLQSVQNSAVKLIYNKAKYDHVTPLLIDAHWLPVASRTVFKTLLFVFKCIHNMAPAYLQDMITLVSYENYNLRSVENKKLKPHKTSRKFGRRSFRSAGPRYWNDLPADIRQIDNLNTFKSRLKTHMFKKAYRL